MTTLAETVARAQVVVCAGSGGVGKTTVAAALAMRAASQQRSVVVVTIDPAKRLADALGLEGLSNDPSPVAGVDGRLDAMMLDTGATFDELVERYGRDHEQRQRILDNRFYRNIANALSGTQEYMAMEKLYELHASGAYDLIVVDTPPSRNALDFLDAPNQLARLLDHRLYRMLTGSGRGVRAAVTKAAQRVLRLAARVIGASVIDDAVSFFAAFDGLEEGFRNRSASVRALLGSDSAAFVLVASPRRDTLGEARYVWERLRAEGIAVRALVINRSHPTFGEQPLDPHREGASPELTALLANLAAFRTVARLEATHRHDLAAAVAPAPTITVELRDDDIHDLAGLREMGATLFR